MLVTIVTDSCLALMRALEEVLPKANKLNLKVTNKNPTVFKYDNTRDRMLKYIPECDPCQQFNP